MAWKNVQYQNGKMRTSEGGGSGGSTVTITPTLLSGEKIADYEIDGVPGALYAPQGGGGGASSLSDLDDVDINNPANGQILVYRGSNSKWENENGLPYVPEIYSTEEREIGVWIDGKPLYQKTFHIIPNSTEIQISISNIDKAVDLKGTWRRIGNNRDYPISTRTESAQYNGYGIMMWYDFDYSYLYLSINGYSYSNLAYIDATVQYTKTTDTAGSGKWTTDGTPTHHYSTTERVIGTWIDDKPIYEKTLHVTSIVANDNWQNIENLSAKLLIDYECIGYTSGGQSGDQTSFRSDKNAPQIQADSSTGYIRYALIPGTPISELYITARYTKTTD